MGILLNGLCLPNINPFPVLFLPAVRPFPSVPLTNLVFVIPHSAHWHFYH